MQIQDDIFKNPLYILSQNPSLKQEFTAFFWWGAIRTTSHPLNPPLGIRPVGCCCFSLFGSPFAFAVLHALFGPIAPPSPSSLNFLLSYTSFCSARYTEKNTLILIKEL